MKGPTLAPQDFCVIQGCKNRKKFITVCQRTGQSKKRYSRQKYQTQGKQSDTQIEPKPIDVPRIDPNSNIPISKQIRARRQFEEALRKQNITKLPSSYRKPPKTASELESLRRSKLKEQSDKQKKLTNAQRQLQSAFHTWQFEIPDVLLIDAYNFINRHEGLKKAIEDVDLGEARRRCDKLFGEYMHLREVKIVLVYDALYGPPYPPFPDKRETQPSGLQVVFTGEYDADGFICQEIKNVVDTTQVRGVFVASSDSDVQTITRANGGNVVSMEYLLGDIQVAFKELRKTLRLQRELAKVHSMRGIRGYCDQEKLEQLERLRDLLPARRLANN
eukprot:TRINITY_DN42306_c0_g1_i2.p1 TRINITY_DN42306_c0_g1~~TRINITY_DN42306_c0_g1_i2.p1  ORF type:complete len:332 (-),score=13.73 TRINITY_DN42306_c0_g1_i2:423-1418(-)